MIIFTAEDHKYVNQEDKQKHYTSVTQLISRYKSKYDEDFWATYKAYQSLLGKPAFNKLLYSYFRSGNITLHSPKLLKHLENKSTLPKKRILGKKKSFIKMWKDKNKRANERGTKYHWYKETLLKKKKSIVNPFTGNSVPVSYVKPGKNADNASYKTLDKLKDGAYPELIIWYKDVVGQADLVIIEDGKIYIQDYKTNKEISQESYLNKKSKKRDMMNKPLGHVMDCNYMHYTLQLSMYAYMLEKRGLEVADLEILHYNKKYKLDYMRNEVESILLHHLQNHSLSHV